MRTLLVAAAVVPVALGYSYDYTDAPTAAPTAETMSPTASMAPTREDISGWAVQSVTSMVAMFSYASAFNRDIGGWAVYRVIDMTFMFAVASSFDQDLGWCVDGGVVTMFMFEGAACTLPSCNVTFGGCPP